MAEADSESATSSAPHVEAQPSALNYSRFDNLDVDDDDDDDGASARPEADAEATPEEEWQWRRMIEAAGMEDELREVGADAPDGGGGGATTTRPIEPPPPPPENMFRVTHARPPPPGARFIDGDVPAKSPREDAHASRSSHSGWTGLG